MKYHKVHVPCVNTNDETYFIFWEVDSGQKARKGDVIACIETTKTVIELTAAQSGYVHILDKDAEQVAPDTIIAVISSDECIDEFFLEELKIPEGKDNKKSLSGKWTKKAEIIAAAYGIDLADVSCEGDVIGQKDVECHLERIRRLSNKRKETDVEWKWAASDQAGPGKKILLVGAGMNAIQALDVLTRQDEYFPIGLVDDDLNKKGTYLKGVPVIGTISDIDDLWGKDFFDELIILMPNNRKARISLFDKFIKKQIPMANVVDPSVHIGAEVEMGCGNLLLPFVRIGACSKIGNNNFFSSGVNIAHHNTIGSHVTFGPAVATSGCVSIGDDVTFGIGIYVEPNISIGDKAVVGSGSTIVSNITPGKIVKTKTHATS